METNLRPRLAGEIIGPNDSVLSIDDLKFHPVEHSIGRIVRPENIGYVFTSDPLPFAPTVPRKNTIEGMFSRKNTIEEIEYA